ncbi:MAG TPA: hypothetical protein VNO33_00315, partial [Kofleriaceae bacterium]|nr:hypothetical protein [Kofleriaceae bacterium]
MIGDGDVLVGFEEVAHARGFTSLVLGTGTVVYFAAVLTHIIEGIRCPGSRSCATWHAPRRALRGIIAGGCGPSRSGVRAATR